MCTILVNIGLFFALHRKHGGLHFLHKEITAESLRSIFGEETQLAGRYGTHIPSEDELGQLRAYFSEKIKKAIMDWAGEKVFLRCFLQSSLAFLLFFYIFSIAIRDPLPILDEFIVSSVVSVILFFSLRKKHYRRLNTKELIQGYEEKMSQIIFRRSSLLVAIELILDVYDELPTAELQKYLQHEDPRCKFDFDHTEGLQFFQYLKRELHFSSRRKEVKRHKQLWLEGTRYIEQDLPLMVIYRQLEFRWERLLQNQD